MRTLAPDDLGDALNKLFRDVQDLKNRLSSPTHTGAGLNPNFDSIFIGDVELLPSISPVLPAPGQTAEIPLLLTTGATENDVWIDVEWAPPADGSASTYEIEIAKETAPGVYGERSFQRASVTNVRFAGLAAETKYAFRVVAINAIGKRSAPNPAIEQSIVSAKDTSPPPGVTNVIIARGATSAIVKFTPLTFAEAGDVAAGNGQYEVQIDTLNTFAGPNLRVVFTNEQIVAFNDLIAVEVWYARVRAIDKSNNAGPWSTIAGPSTAGGVIDAMIVADLSAAKITTGFLSASRIQANSLSADKISTSTLTAAWITLGVGGALLAGSGSPFTGAFFSSTGIRLYKDGVETVILDALTGDATFTGFVDAAFITGSAFNWGVGVLDLNGMRIFASNNSGTSDGPLSNARSVSFIKPVSGFETCWSMWAPNYGTLRIDRVNRNAAGTGTLSDIVLGARHAVLTEDRALGYQCGTINLDVNNTSDSSTYFVGQLSCTWKPFFIDHPSRPDEAFLMHSALEGPEDGIFYRGKAKLSKGKTTIKLPDYFVDLCRDTDYAPPTVMLTPIKGGPAGVLEVSEVVDGKFTVEGNGDKSFFWMVNAARTGRRPGEPYEVEIEKDVLVEASQWIDAVREAVDSGQDLPAAPLTTVGGPYSRR